MNSNIYSRISESFRTELKNLIYSKSPKTITNTSIIWKFITSNGFKDDEVVEIAFIVKNDIFGPPKCKICGSPVSFLNFKKGYKDGCSASCSVKLSQDNRKQTCLEKYGVDHPSKDPSVIKKKDDTCLEKYGSTNPMKNKDVAKLQQDTMMAVYGGLGRGSKVIQTKAIQTMKENYGVEFPFQSKEIREKRDNTWNEIYGGNPLSDKEIIEKRNNTMMDRYGTIYPLQVEEFFEKAKSYSLKEFNDHMLQGFEPQAMEYIKSKLNCEYSDFVSGKGQFQEIIYIGEDGESHRYYPDFYCTKNDTLYEVKSTWTYSCGLDVIERKLKAAKLLYNNVVLIIWDKSGVVEIPY